MNQIKSLGPRDIAHHNREADQAHRQALVALDQYNAAMHRLQAAMSTIDVLGATQAEAEADAAWAEMRTLLDRGYSHRNSAAIAAGLASEIFRQGDSRRMTLDDKD